jgi:glutamate 5-kinase
MRNHIDRKDLVLSSRTWVVKVGTSVLANDDGTIDHGRVDHLADQVCAVMGTGRRVALVTSGAVGAGIGQLGLSRRPDSLPQVQAAAAVGQAYLMRAYDEGFRLRHRRAAQVLLTHGDFDRRGRYLNIRNTLNALFRWGAVPVINENDTVSVDELKFGDNDRLAAMVANLIQAEVTVILSVVDGLCRKDSETGVFGELIPLVESNGDGMEGEVVGSCSTLGTGGMLSKLRAAAAVTRGGGAVIVTSGRKEGSLTRILAGEPDGTLFLPIGPCPSARRRWIGLAARPQGSLVVDDGARAAIITREASLLPVGLVEVMGEFRKGAVVSIVDLAQAEFGRGLTNLNSDDARRVRGLRTGQARHVLGCGPGYDEVVHRDNLILIG